MELKELKFLGISKPCGVNKGDFIGNAYLNEDNRYSLSTFVYSDNGILTHDITCIENDIKVYQKFNGDLIYINL